MTLYFNIAVTILMILIDKQTKRIKEALNQRAKEQAQQEAQEKANAMKCDCPPTKNWSANAYADGDP